MYTLVYTLGILWFSSNSYLYSDYTLVSGENMDMKYLYSDVYTLVVEYTHIWCSETRVYIRVCMRGI